MARKSWDSWPPRPPALALDASPAAAAAGNRLKCRFRTTALLPSVSFPRHLSASPCRSFLHLVCAFSSICKQKCKQLLRRTSRVAFKLANSAWPDSVRSGVGDRHESAPTSYAMNLSLWTSWWSSSSSSLGQVGSPAVARAPRVGPLSGFSHLRISPACSPRSPDTPRDTLTTIHPRLGLELAYEISRR